MKDSLPIRLQKSRTKKLNETVSARLATMKTSCGADYFVMLKCGDRELSLWKSRERYQMEYQLAEMNWLLNGGEKPDIMAFDEVSHPNLYPNTHPADIARTASQSDQGEVKRTARELLVQVDIVKSWAAVGRNAECVLDGLTEHCDALRSALNG